MHAEGRTAVGDNCRDARLDAVVEDGLRHSEGGEGGEDDGALLGGMRRRGVDHHEQLVAVQRLLRVSESQWRGDRRRRRW